MKASLSVWQILDHALEMPPIFAMFIAVTHVVDANTGWNEHLQSLFGIHRLHVLI